MIRVCSRLPICAAPENPSYHLDGANKHCGYQHTSARMNPPKVPVYFTGFLDFDGETFFSPESTLSILSSIFSESISNLN